MAIEQLTASELAALWKAEPDLRVLDVRTPWEWETASIEGSELVDQELAAALFALPPDTPLAFVCHHGIRSQAAARHFEARGFTRLFNLRGGIDAWSQTVDASVPRY